MEKGGKGGFSDEKNNHLSYAQACNLGISESSGEYISIIRDNTVATEGWLSGMIECLNSSADIGIVGPMTVNVDGRQGIEVDEGLSLRGKAEAISGSGKIAAHPPGARNDKINGHLKIKAMTEKILRGSPKPSGRRTEYRRIDVRQLDSFCLLFRHGLTEKTGLFDESLKTGKYAGDDYFLRAALDGIRAVIAGDVFIHYYGHVTAGGKKAVSLRLAQTSGSSVRNGEVLMNRLWNRNGFSL